MPSNLGWLIDKSAYVRLATCRDRQAWMGRAIRGLVSYCTATALEIGFSARNVDDWHRNSDRPPLSWMSRVYSTPHAENRAIEVQGVLAERGEHRAPSMPDLMIAAIAETAGLTVLHVGKDFELIAEITEQPIERLVLAEDPAG
jgi:predicted nucleic acid-binding protein